MILQRNTLNERGDVSGSSKRVKDDTTALKIKLGLAKKKVRDTKTPEDEGKGSLKKNASYFFRKCSNVESRKLGEHKEYFLKV